MTNNVWTHNDLKIDFSSKIAMLNNEVINLSKTELEILKLFIKSEGIVLTREQILNSIWGSSQVVSDRTIAVSYTPLDVYKRQIWNIVC